MKSNSVLSESERDRIRAARKAKGLSRQALSEKIFYSCAAIEAVENGKKNPSLEFLRIFCKAVDFDINGLFDAED